MNIFAQLVKSLYSPGEIAKYRFQGIGKTILYVFLLALISVIPTAIYTSTSLSMAVDTAEDTIKNRLPAFTIENNELKADVKEPKTIKEDNLTIIFDPTGTVAEADMTDMENTVAMLRNDFVIAAGGQTNAIPYAMFGEAKMTKDDLLSLVANAATSLPIVISLMVIAIYVFAAGAKFIEISLLALFGMLLKNLAGKNLQYRHLWRMTAYSVTLATIFFTIMTSLKVAVPYAFIINWFVSSMVLLLAIKEVPSPKK